MTLSIATKEGIIVGAHCTTCYNPRGQASESKVVAKEGRSVERTWEGTIAIREQAHEANKHHMEESPHHLLD